MTCFWDGILTGLNKFPDFKQKSQFSDFSKVNNRAQFIEFCEKNANLLKNEREYILWNDNIITEIEINTHHIPRILELDKTEKTNGYFCGSCDSFLLFICAYFKLNIHHKGQNFQYKNENTYNNYYYNWPNEKGFKDNKTLYFQSNRGHFNFVSHVNN